MIEVQSNLSPKAIYNKSLIQFFFRPEKERNFFIRYCRIERWNVGQKENWVWGERERKIAPAGFSQPVKTLHDVPHVIINESFYFWISSNMFAKQKDADTNRINSTLSRRGGEIFCYQISEDYCRVRFILPFSYDTRKGEKSSAFTSWNLIGFS